MGRNLMTSGTARMSIDPFEGLQSAVHCQHEICVTVKRTNGCWFPDTRLNLATMSDRMIIDGFISKRSGTRRRTLQAHPVDIT